MAQIIALTFNLYLWLRLSSELCLSPKTCKNQGEKFVSSKIEWKQTQGYSKGKITTAQNSSLSIPPPSLPFVPFFSPLIFPFHFLFLSFPLTPSFPLPKNPVRSSVGPLLAPPAGSGAQHRIAVNCICTNAQLELDKLEIALHICVELHARTNPKQTD